MGMLFVTLRRRWRRPCSNLGGAGRHRPGPGLDLRDVLAAAVFLVAIVGETASDAQMKRFRADPANKGQVIQTGLWPGRGIPTTFSSGWAGSPIGDGLDPAVHHWLTLTAPAVMYGLLRYVSGVPPLEDAMLTSRGDRFATTSGASASSSRSPKRA